MVCLHSMTIHVILGKEKVISMADYSKTIFAKGVVCFNTNNYSKCVVIDGSKGNENDRCSLVLENFFAEGLRMHTPPNRALIPTGEYLDIGKIEDMLYISSADFKEKVWGDKDG